ncbi:MAG: hypothetical protein HY592_01785 [Candidatus Omnitrophica bacterium]|nr:hypothetical protein [Candidatus Omnitrophota bacterium]
MTTISLERWNAMPLGTRLLNVASELTRAKNLAAEDADLTRLSIERALDLLDLTVETARADFNFTRELLRLREALGGQYQDPEKDSLEAILKIFLDMKAETHNLGLEV